MVFTSPVERRPPKDSNVFSFPTTETDSKFVCQTSGEHEGQGHVRHSLQHGPRGRTVLQVWGAVDGLQLRHTQHENHDAGHGRRLGCHRGNTHPGICPMRAHHRSSETS